MINEKQNGGGRILQILILFCLYGMCFTPLYAKQDRGYYGIKQSRNKSKETHVIALIHRYFIDLISFIFLTVKNLFLVHFCCTFVTRNKIIFITLTSEKPEWGHKIETNKSI